MVYYTILSYCVFRYYFKVLKARRLMTIKINICNFTKNDSLYDKVFFLNIIILRA